MKAMILAAGFGTRLSPFTDTNPKALVLHKKIPMIAHTISYLKNSGIDSIVVNAHHHFEKIVNYFSEKDLGVDVNVVVENKILGTGGGVLNAAEFLKDEACFVVMNVDIETDIDLKAMIAFHKMKNPFVTLAVQKRKTKRYLEFDSDMNLIGRENDNSVKENLYAFNGIHVISNKIFEKNFPVMFLDIIEIYLQSKGEKITGYDCGKCTFKDLGKPENLI